MKIQVVIAENMGFLLDYLISSGRKKWNKLHEL